MYFSGKFIYTRKMFKLFISVFCLTCQLSFAEVIWDIQSHRSKESLLNKNFIKYVVEPINQELKGELKLVFHSQDFASTLHKNVQSFSEVRYGNVEGMFSATMYWGKADPIFAIFGDLVAAWENPDDFLSWYKNGGGDKFIKEAYEKYNLKFVGFTLSPHESLVANVPLKNLDDFKGKIIRVPLGSMTSEYFSLLGALARPTPISKVKMALQKKAVDIADYGTLGVNYNEGLYKNAHHTNLPGFHSLPVLDFVVNLNQWNNLSTKAKQVIEKHVKNWQIKNIKSLQLQNNLALKKALKENLIVYKWSKEELKKARNKASEVWQQFALKSPEAKEMIQSIMDWLKKNDRL